MCERWLLNILNKFSFFDVYLVHTAYPYNIVVVETTAKERARLVTKVEFVNNLLLVMTYSIIVMKLKILVKELCCSVCWRN